MLQIIICHGLTKSGFLGKSFSLTQCYLVNLEYEYEQSEYIYNLHPRSPKPSYDAIIIFLILA